MWNQNGWLCSKLGLTITSQTQKCLALPYDKDLFSSTLGMTIKAGDATGMAAIVTTQTKEGIELVTKCIGKVYTPEEFDTNEWTLVGEPEMTVVVNRPDTVGLTCSTIVNRLPILIDCPPGYISSDIAPCTSYMVQPMNHYVKSK